MSLLVRKIDRAKWEQTDIRNGADVSADAITGDLRTTANTLTVWEIESLDDLEEAVLAIVSAGTHLESIDVVAIRADALVASVAELEYPAGQEFTPVDDLNRTHRNLAHLSYLKLGTVARSVVDVLGQDGVRRYTEGNLKGILKAAISKGRLNPDRLSEFIKRKLEK